MVVSRRNAAVLFLHFGFVVYSSEWMAWWYQNSITGDLFFDYFDVVEMHKEVWPREGSTGYYYLPPPDGTLLKTNRSSTS